MPLPTKGRHPPPAPLPALCLTTSTGFHLSPPLHALLVDEILPGLRLDPAPFPTGFADLLRRFTPRNADLLATRARLQTEIDQWWTAQSRIPPTAETHEAFFRGIGYLEPAPAPAPFTIDTTNVDPEIATTAGPQLVPLSRARYALNTANQDGRVARAPTFLRVTAIGPRLRDSSLSCDASGAGTNRPGPAS